MKASKHIRNLEASSKTLDSEKATRKYPIATNRAAYCLETFISK